MNKGGLHASFLITKLFVLAGVIILVIHPNSTVANLNALFNAAEQFQKKMLASHRDNIAIMVHPGLVADRKSQYIDLVAVSTGIAKNEPVEFLLISPVSGHAYESFALTAIKPSVLHHALEFIGLDPGRPVNSEELAFWPKGERVKITIACRDTNYWPGRIEATALVRNSKSKSLKCFEGFMFVGSRWIKAPDSTNFSYLADMIEPHALVSLYNEPSTVLDLPRKAPQSTTYGSWSMNPDYILPENVLLDIHIEPARRSGIMRIYNLNLIISFICGGTNGLAGVRASLQENDGKPILHSQPISEIIRFFSKLVDNNFDPFVTLYFNGNVTVEQAKSVCKVLSLIEGEYGIRIESPPLGTIYYKAFIPNEKYRSRAFRHIQPWELHLFSPSSTNHTTLTLVEEVWKDDRIYPELNTTDYIVNNVSQLQSLINIHNLDLSVILVFAEPAVTHAALMHILAPVISTYKAIHVFVK